MSAKGLQSTKIPSFFSPVATLLGDTIPYLFNIRRHGTQLKTAVLMNQLTAPLTKQSAVQTR